MGAEVSAWVHGCRGECMASGAEVSGTGGTKTPSWKRLLCLWQ